MMNISAKKYNYILYAFLAETEMDFTVPLKDVTVLEKKQAKFECTITRDVPIVIWTKGSEIITSGKKYEIIDDGKKHMLIINNCDFDDEGHYAIEVLSKKSIAKLTVQGKCFFCRSICGKYSNKQELKHMNCLILCHVYINKYSEIFQWYLYHTYTVCLTFHHYVLLEFYKELIIITIIDVLHNSVDKLQ